MSRSDVVEALGLVVNDAPREVALENGVVLVMRPPEGKDWVIARAALAEVTQADKILTAAGRRYGWSARDKIAMADPDVWETVGVWCLAVEMASLIVSEVYRLDGDERRSVEASVETFRELFRLGDNLDLFNKAMRSAELDLFQPKKG